jgi:dTDP-4-dehydrorhamnose reductase
MSTPRYKKILITGARGQLACAMQRSAPPNTECVGVARDELDIRDENAVREIIEESRADLVINGAAYNLVDKAENEGSEAALEINALGVANLAKSCRDADIPLVHFSTDYVFDGSKSTPYVEADATRPLGIYAASKLAGENIALTCSAQHFAIRVCRLFGPAAEDGAGSSRKPAGNFPALMLRLGRERGSVRVVNDQIGSPTYTPDLARAVWQLIEGSDGGLFQLCNSGEVAFDEYARRIFQIAGVECEVVPVSSEEYGAAATRPEYSTLSNAKAESYGVTPLRNWEDALREYIQSYDL